MAFGSGPDHITQRLRSIPIKVHWAGFESDTHRMQQAGWAVSAYEEVERGMMRLAFTRDGGQFAIGQPNRMKGISRPIDYDYFSMLGDPYGTNRPEIVAEIMAVGSRVHIHEHGLPDLATKFHPVDCTPQLWQGAITSLDDMGHFVPAGNVAPQDIIVADESVEELLARILEKQQEAKVQRATLKYYEEKGSLLVPKVHAKIITLADYQKAG